MTDLLNPKGKAVWQLNKPIFEMTNKEKLDALGYCECLIMGGFRNFFVILRTERLRKSLRCPPKDKVKHEQMQLFDIQLKRRRG